MTFAAARHGVPDYATVTGSPPVTVAGRRLTMGQ